MHNLKDKIFAAERLVCGSLLVLMMTLVFLATVGRYTKTFNMSWSDEASRYCMIWIVFVGAGLSAYRNELFNVDIVVDLLPLKWQKYCVYIRILLVIAFCVFAVYYGIHVVQRQIQMNQTSPSLKLPMWLMYSSVPLGCFSLMLHYIGLGVLQLRAINEKLKGGGAECQ